MIQNKTQEILPGILEKQFKDQVTRLEDQDFVGRLLNLEKGVFQYLKKTETKDIDQHLGWIYDHDKYLSESERITAFVNRVKESGTRYLLFIGAGAESAITEMMLDHFGKQPWLKDFIIVNSTAPSEIEAIVDRIDWCKSFMIVSSNSGSDLETLALHRYFFKQMKERRPLKLGEHFAAVTTAGTELHRIARRNRFTETFLNFGNCSDCFSALSFTGLIPAAFTRAKPDRLLTTADKYLTDLQASTNANDAFASGALIGLAVENGFTTLNFQMPATLSGFYKWLKQLIGESLAGSRVGILPYARQPGASRLSGNHVDINYSLQKGGKFGVGSERMTTKEIPRININLTDSYQLAKEIIKWEISVVAASKILSINPFNRNGGEESERSTARVLRKKVSRRREIIKPSLLSLNDIDIVSIYNIGRARASRNLEATAIFDLFRNRIDASDYIAVLCYTERNQKIEKKLARLKQELERLCQVPVVCEYGPQYLRTIGRLFRGASARGHFLILERNYVRDIDIPKSKYGFTKLIESQAQGDIQALAKCRRPILNICLKNDPVAGLSQIVSLFAQI